MKKTLTTLAIITAASMAFAETASTNTTDKNTAQGAYSGWVGSLSDSYLTTSTTLTETVTLSQVSVMSANTDGSGFYTNAVKMAILTFSDVASGGEVVGISTNSVAWSEYSALTFSFDDITLDSDTTYRFVFVKDDTSETKLESSNWTAEYQGRRLQVVADSGNMLTNINGPASWGDANWAPNVTYTVSNQGVPEPATATLSLLALAGLAARRRRK